MRRKSPREIQNRGRAVEIHDRGYAMRISTTSLCPESIVVFIFAVLLPTIAVGQPAENILDTATTISRSSSDSAAALIGEYRQFAMDQMDRTERFYEKMLDNTYETVGLFTVFVTILVGLLGVGVPLLLQSRHRKELLHDFDRKLSDSLTSLKEQSETFSLALTNYGLGVINLYETRLHSFYYLGAFNNFVSSLKFLTQSAPSKQLPALYDACLRSITKCKFQRWGQMYQPDVDSLRDSLRFLRQRWSEHQLIMELVKEIEVWINGPPDKGDEIQPMPK